MVLTRGFSHIVPVISEPPKVKEKPQVYVPEVGLRWGASASFQFPDRDASPDLNDQTGINAIYDPEKKIKDISITDFSEIWRASWEGDIDRDKETPELDEFSIQETKKWMIPGTSYNEPDPSRLGSDKRTVEVTIQFDMPPVPRVQFFATPTEATAGAKPKGL